MKINGDEGKIPYIKKKQQFHYQVYTGKTFFKGMEMNELKIMGYDIETDGLEFEMVYDSYYKKYIKEYKCTVEMIAIVTNDGYEKILDGESEEILIKKFFDEIKKYDPDILTAFHCNEFDMTILYQKAEKYNLRTDFGRRANSRIKRTYSRTKIGDNKALETPVYNIFGRHHIDLYYMVQKYDAVSRSLSSHSLKTVIKELGLEREGRVHINGNDISNMLKEDRQKVIDYCLDDTRDVIDLFNFLMPVYFEFTKMLPMGFQEVATGGNTTLLSGLYYRYYFFNSWSIPEAEKKEGVFEGAKTDCETKGVFKNVFNFDVSSLYPSIMIKDKIMSPKDELGLTIKLLTLLRDKRLKAKKKEKEAKDRKDEVERGKWFGINNAFKILINVFYGALGSEFFNWNYIEGASKVTAEGRRILGIMIETLTNAGFISTIFDTDGVYMALEDPEKWNKVIGLKQGEVVPRLGTFIQLGEENG
jgi:DNA polymerase elongation subunit (family B)